MGYRIRGGFEHLTVADLSREDKDAFARRWCALTERPDRREAAASELIREIHSSDRIERLTGNPMLLTNMALIKRKIGRLPQRRVDLYEKAVEVLLNWRSQVDAALDPRDALPQLEYLAGIALVQGHYRDRSKGLAEAIAPLAGQVGHSNFPRWDTGDFAVAENWREALRLCLAACGDDMVEAALLAILHPLPCEVGTARPRAVMAGLCLADEPNVGEAAAEEVLGVLVAVVGETDGGEPVGSSLDAAVMELARSRWSAPLGNRLLEPGSARDGSAGR